MYHPVRRKSFGYVLISLIYIAVYVKHSASAKINDVNNDNDINFDNNISDIDNNFNDKLYKNDWNGKNPFDRDLNRHTISNKLEGTEIKATNIDNSKDKLKDSSDKNDGNLNDQTINKSKLDQHIQMLHVVPLKLMTGVRESINTPVETTTEFDLTVIPLTTSERNLINEKLAITTESVHTTPREEHITTTQNIVTTAANLKVTTQKNISNDTVNETNKQINNKTQNLSKESQISNETSIIKDKNENSNKTIHNSTTKVLTARFIDDSNDFTTKGYESHPNATEVDKKDVKTLNSTAAEIKTIIIETNATAINKNATRNYPSEEVIFNSTKDSSKEEDDVALFSELDLDDQKDVPEDFYDAKDVIPTKAPSTDALSVIFGLAGSVVESVAERVVPKSLLDLFKRMQKQNEALELERLRSREENGGLGQFTRGILKSITSGITKPLNQLMAGVRDIGSLDTDRGFVSSVASGVSSVANVANSLSDAFKNRVQAIYPGTLWCGDGHSAQARSSELGLFFFTDTCCRQHDACKIFIRAGETKYGLTNTGLFTRSHCGCDQQFRECLRKTNSLVSSQIGLTYFNVLGPQCFRKTHPIVRCSRKTRLTGQKCEEYELDYTKEKMWQWFDNETF